MCLCLIFFLDTARITHMDAEAMRRVEQTQRADAALEESPMMRLGKVLVAGVALLMPLKTAGANYKELIGGIKTFLHESLLEDTVHGNAVNILMLHEQIVFTGICALADLAANDEKVDTLLKTVLFDAPASKERVAEAANALGLGADSPAVSMCSSVMDSYEEVALCTW